MTDAKHLLEAFKQLSTKQMKSVHKSALGKVSRLLVTTTRKNLRKLGYKTKSLEKGIKSKVDKQAESATIHIMGDYRLKFFEMGTVERITKRKKHYKKPKSTGKIKSGWYFKDAIDQQQQTVERNLEESIQKEIVKRFNKK